jgi:DNA polymerase-3 subunit epsilon
MPAMDDLNQPLSETTFALFDVETTGLNPAYGHRVCEVACLRVQNSQEIARFESLVDPTCPISEGAFHVNRITPDMLAGAPLFAEIAIPLLALLDGAVLVAHNAPFDLGFLAAELEIAGLPPPQGTIVDTLALVRRLYHFASNSLPAVAAAMAIETGSAHRAMGDVWTTHHVLERILYDLESRWGVATLSELVAFQGGPIPYPHPCAVPLPPAIAEALGSGGRVRMRYVNAAGQETDRLVQPLRVQEDRGYLYLIAHCYRTGEQRTFRLDRVIEMTVER